MKNLDIKTGILLKRFLQIYLPCIPVCRVGILCIGCLNIDGTHVTANNSTNNNVVFFPVSDFKIIYNNNY